MGALSPLQLVIGSALLTLVGLVLLAAKAWQAQLHANNAERLIALTRPEALESSIGVTARLLRFVGARLIGERDRRDTTILLHAAGFHRPEAPALFILLRLGLAIVATGAMTAWVVLYATQDSARLWPVAAGGAAWLLPKMFLGSRGVARQARVRKEMSFLCDLMRLVLESGLSLDQCLRYVAAVCPRTSPSLSHGMHLLIQDIDKGMAYHAAIERWGERLGIPDGRELAAVFQQSLTYGTELAPLLRAFAEEWSERRVAAAREAAGRKATRLTAVMVVFFLPPLMILVISPSVVSVLTMSGGN